MSGYWLVSARLRQVMEAIDPEAFITNADYRLADGSEGPTYFLCDVIRTVDALDEEASQLNIVISDDYEEGKYYRLTGDVRLAFKRDVLGSAHVFRLPFHGESSATECSRMPCKLPASSPPEGPMGSGLKML